MCSEFNCKDAKCKGHRAYGTCFLLPVRGPVSYMLTNNHVVKDGGPNVKIMATRNPAGEFTGRVIGSDSVRDLALIRSKDMPTAQYTPVALAQKSPAPGSRVEIVGYPMSYWHDIGRKDKKVRAWFPIIYKDRNDQQFSVFTGAAPFEGNSGSPGFSQSKVVTIFHTATGVNTLNGPRYTGGIGTPVETIWSFLRDAAQALPDRPELGELFQ